MTIDITRHALTATKEPITAVQTDPHAAVSAQEVRHCRFVVQQIQRLMMVARRYKSQVTSVKVTRNCGLKPGTFQGAIYCFKRLRHNQFKEHNICCLPRQWSVVKYVADVRISRREHIFATITWV